MGYLTIIPLLALAGCAVREGPCEGMVPGGWCRDLCLAFLFGLYAGRKSKGTAD
jgi:hypothetical protein